MRNRADDGAGLARRTLLTMALTAPALAAGTADAAEPAPTPDLARALNDYEKAVLGHDIEALGELVSADYVLVNSDTTIQDKQSYLGDFRVPGSGSNAMRRNNPCAKYGPARP